MSLKNTAQESEAILAQHNRAASELTYRGEVIVNRNSGQDPQGSNIRAMAAWADPEVLDGLQARLFELDHDEPPMVFISTQNGLFVVEGVVGGVGVALAGWGRGLPMMGVVTLPIWKTPTWTTLPSTVLI